MSEAVPVILLTGYLGAGKTSLLNHLLRHPDARIGVVVNDFGDLNIDAGLVVGQVDEPFSISGGCICCLDDDSSLEDALVALAKPSLRLDAIIVEASGFAEPLTLARMVTRMGRHRFHLGGVIDVVDALMHSSTVDTEALPPMRYAATTLVLVNKLDQVPAEEREAAVEAVRSRVHRRNPRVLVIGTSFGRLDPTLIFDPGAGEHGSLADRRGADSHGGAGLRRGDAPSPTDAPLQPELPIRELIRAAYAERQAEIERGAETDHGPDGGHESAGHRHAQAITVTGTGWADPDRVMDFLEDLPAGVYRVKGQVRVAERSATRHFGVQAVGPNVYVSDNGRCPGTGTGTGTGTGHDSVLVVIGEGFDETEVRDRLEPGLSEDANSAGLERLLRQVRLHS
ncbi:cobalamin biosynthesis protein CobW [Brevibacterium sp. CCUG 69071]|nr:cobalamin biosynthesis protein CobW [Brevibacterium sp. CCUG 69071]